MTPGMLARGPAGLESFSCRSGNNQRLARSKRRFLGKGEPRPQPFKDCGMKGELVFNDQVACRKLRGSFYFHFL